MAVMRFLIVSLGVALDAVPHPQEINWGWVNTRADGFNNDATAKSNLFISELNPNNGVFWSTPSMNPANLNSECEKSARGEHYFSCIRVSF